MCQTGELTKKVEAENSVKSSIIFMTFAWFGGAVTKTICQ